VRNDTGVYEGGEISTFYDPMIAKLCTWAPTRSGAINAMENALDRFEIEGVGHNIAFLQAVMNQQRFNEGRLSTAYIAEEFPDGFNGVELDEEVLAGIAAFAACAGFRREPGIGRQRAVILGGRVRQYEVSQTGEGFVLSHDGGHSRVELEWRPGDKIARVVVDGISRVLQVGRITGGFRVRYRGADLAIKVVTPRVAELLEIMPEKIVPDMSRFLLCPMPGQVVALEVKEGQVVEDGQALAIVEAMKMENVLRAEKRVRVATIHVEVGGILAVDEIIMEFEGI